MERSRAWGAPVRLGNALVALGKVSRGREGVAFLEEAVEVLEKGPNEHELCQALYALGTHRETDPRRRASVLERAYMMAVDQGASSFAEKIARKKSGELARLPLLTAGLHRPNRKLRVWLPTVSAMPR